MKHTRKKTFRKKFRKRNQKNFSKKTTLKKHSTKGGLFSFFKHKQKQPSNPFGNKEYLPPVEKIETHVHPLSDYIMITPTKPAGNMYLDNKANWIANPRGKKYG